jgi:internalin A
VEHQSELIGRDFTRRWNLEMAKMEAECPNTFMLLPGSGSRFNPKNWVCQDYRFLLVCQHPPQPHPVEQSYPLRQAKEWWVTVSPWLNRLILFLKFGVPLAGKTLEAVLDEVDDKQWQNTITLLEEVTKDVARLPALDAMDRSTTVPILRKEQKMVGPALRALQSYLEAVDPHKIWGGLHKTVTPDGHILWLCAPHRQQYESRPLQLD